MPYLYRTKLKGCVAMTPHYHSDTELQQDKSLFKFVWVKEGQLTVEVDHVVMTLQANDLIALTPLHEFQIRHIDGTYITLLFNSNFYCIYGHDSEVSCNGILFHGSSDVLKLSLTPEQAERMGIYQRLLCEEFRKEDSLQDEALRSLLKLLIICCTRIVREKYRVAGDTDRGFDLVRRFYVLVDQHYKEKKQVQEYADLLHRSPKTLSHVFATYDLGTPLRVIHERIDAEARRLLMHTTKSAKEIGEILGFEDQASFSRFFKKMTGQSIFEYRKTGKDAPDDGRPTGTPLA